MSLCNYDMNWHCEQEEVGQDAWPLLFRAWCTVATGVCWKVSSFSWNMYCFASIRVVTIEFITRRFVDKQNVSRRGIRYPRLLRPFEEWTVKRLISYSPWEFLGRSRWIDSGKCISLGAARHPTVGGRLETGFGFLIVRVIANLIDTVCQGLLLRHALQSTRRRRLRPIRTWCIQLRLAHFACIYLSHLPIVSLMSCPCLFESCRRMNQGFAPIIVQSTAEGTIGASDCWCRHLFCGWLPSAERHKDGQQTDRFENPNSNNVRGSLVATIFTTVQATPMPASRVLSWWTVLKHATSPI
jgi:hypothetical protein